MSSKTNLKSNTPKVLALGRLCLPKSQDTPSADKSIISVSVKVDDIKRLAKQAVMPTWDATRSLLLSNTHESITRTNTEVIAPLFKASPTDIKLCILHWCWHGVYLQLSLVQTGDLENNYNAWPGYNCALQIQHTVGNTYWILRAGVLHIVFAVLTLLAKQLMVVDLIHVQIKKAYIHLGSSTWNLWWQSIQARNRIPHHNQLSNHDGVIWFKCKRDWIHTDAMYS